MSLNLSEKIVVVISTTAIFNLDTILAVKSKLNPSKFESYQKKRRHTLLQPGIAFELTKKLLAANSLDITLPKIEVGSFSHRFYCTDYSIKQYGLIFDANRMDAIEGTEPIRHSSIFNTDLFMSDKSEDLMFLKSQGYLTALISKTSTGISVFFDTNDEYLLHRIKLIEHLFN